VALPGGASEMPDYRLYRLDGAGKITRVELISASDDEEAAALAQAASDAMRAELWLRDRRVAQIGPAKNGVDG
jgi:hypothetical protein